MAATEHADDYESYYVPHQSKLPIWVAFGLIVFMYGFGSWLNSIKSGGNSNLVLFLIGFGIVGVSLYMVRR